MKRRQLFIILTLTAGSPVFILGAQFAGATLPLVPACAIAAVICGTGGYFLCRAFWKLIQF
jgi:hypothetical protein